MKLEDVVPRIHVELVCVDCGYETAAGITKIALTGRYQLLCSEGCGHGDYPTPQAALASITGDRGKKCNYKPTDVRFVNAATNAKGFLEELARLERELGVTHD